MPINKQQIDFALSACKDAGIKTCGLEELKSLRNYSDNNPENDRVAGNCFELFRYLLQNIATNKDNVKKIEDLLTMWAELSKSPVAYAMTCSRRRMDLTVDELNYLRTGIKGGNVMPNSYNVVNNLTELFEETINVLEVKRERSAPEQQRRIDAQITFLREQISRMAYVKDVSSPAATELAWQLYNKTQELRDDIQKDMFNSVNTLARGITNYFVDISNLVGDLGALPVTTKVAKPDTQFDFHCGQDGVFIACLTISNFRERYQDMQFSLESIIDRTDKAVSDYDKQIKGLEDKKQEIIRKYTDAKARFDNGEIGKDTFSSISQRCASEMNTVNKEIQAKITTRAGLLGKLNSIYNLKNKIVEPIEAYLIEFGGSDKSIVSMGNDIINTLDQMCTLLRGETLDQNIIDENISVIQNTIAEARRVLLIEQNKETIILDKETIATNSTTNAVDNYDPMAELLKDEIDIGNTVTNTMSNNNVINNNTNQNGNNGIVVNNHFLGNDD